MKSINILLLLVLFSTSSHSIENTNSIKQAEHASKLFFSVCVPSEGNVQNIKTAVKPFNMQFMNARATQHFVGSSTASAWLQHKYDGSYIVSLDKGVCTVMSRFNDKEHLLSLVNDFLPNGEGGYTTKKVDTKNSGYLTTISYLITAKDGRNYRVVVSSSDQPKIKLQGMISYQRVNH